MTVEELNTQLYRKLFAEQERYRDWLLTQPGEEILKHSYEYTVREDFLLALEYTDLEEKQVKALLDKGITLDDLFRDFEKRETDHMSDITFTIESRADRIIREAERGGR